MSNTKALVKTIFSHANDYEWSLQGFGMLRLYLNKEVRLHIWDDRYRVTNVSDIHNHPWDFESEVVVGVIKNRRYEVKPIPMGLYSGARILCGPGGGLQKSESDKLDFDLNYRDYLYEAGQQYTQTKNEVHRSIADNGTVTIVKRVFWEDTEHAMVYWPRGEQWVSAEPRKATATEVSNIVSASLKWWF